MKLSCTQENLNRGLNIVARSVSSRASLPVLANILLQTEKGRLKLSATDLEIGIHTYIGAKVDAEGAITIPAKLLLDFVTTNTDKTINLTLKDLTLELTSDHFKANIKGIESSEFPLIPEVKKAEALELPALEFAGAINKTLIATALDETRPVLAGIFLYSQADKVKMVATDSYRLAEVTLNLNKKISKDISVIVPHRTMAELARILDGSVEKVQILTGDNQIEFIANETVLVSRLIEGVFPDYIQIIPTKTSLVGEVSKTEFASAIKMASLFARESANNIKLKFLAQEVQVLATSAHVGDNVSTVAAKVTGEPLEIAFNAKFILDFLNVIDSDLVNLEFSNNLAPGLVRAAKSPNYLYVIMPLRIEE